MTAPSEIKAWTFTKPPFPTTLKLSTMSLPSPLPAAAVLVRTRAAALNPVDVQLQNFSIFGLPFLDYPKTPGADFAGEIIWAGAEAEAKGGWEVGDEVCGVTVDLRGWGTLADVVFIDTARAKLTMVRKPEGWSWEQAASLGVVWMTARTSIARVEPWMDRDDSSSSGSSSGGGGGGGTSKKNKLVVLGGSSATGMYTVHQAKRRGWQVLATCSGRNADFVRGMGADEVVDYTKQSVADEVRRFDAAAIVDCVGGTETIGLADRYVTIVGDKTTRHSMGGSFLYLTSPRMVGRWLMGRLGLGKPYDCIVYEPHAEWFEEIRALDRDNVAIDSTFAFEDLHKAYERLNTGRVRGKVVITIP